jgi:arsenate reductase-like glutaredoxin family protein
MAMIELYGIDTCSDCTIAKMLFEKYDIKYHWVDVSKINGFNDEIPRIKLDDGTIITGVSNIKKLLMVTFYNELSLK